ncbi:MAG: hypothetical protein JJT89_05250 [Nitriliruptoraceae bacterium]|nr:hypothetical protein [Nitriliruptoraceae bacterium]
MSAPRDAETLADAAYLYYVEDLSQEQVAKALATTRSNVSRMLRAAREQGIVRFQVVRPLNRQRALERAVMEHFPVSEAIVLAADAAVDTLPQVGELAARWLTDNVKDGMRLTLSWGRTLNAMAEALEVDEAFDVDVVQMGGDLQLDPQYSGHELVREVAARLGGRYSYLHAPAILDTPDVVDELRSLRGIDEELQKARSADLALVGIGAYGHGFAAQLLESAHLTPDERAMFAAAPPAGDILGRFFDQAGEQLETPLRDRVLALELDEVRAIPTVVGMAAGADKGPGIWGALRGGWIDVLITDQAAAASALHLHREMTK